MTGIRTIRVSSSKRAWKHLPKKDSQLGGAIGGVTSFTFTPTGLGVIVKVRCGCGEEVDITDFDSW